MGLHRIDVIEKIGSHYVLHPLVLEDILNVGQRPKVENYDDYIFVVLKMLTYSDESHEIESGQVCVIMGKNFVFTFQERKGDVFEPVRERLKKNKGIIRKNGSDYLLYTLLDVVVDNYFVILEKIEEEVEFIDYKVILEPSPEVVQTIHRLKRNLIELRKSIWPLREVLSILSKGEMKLLSKKKSLYFTAGIYGMNFKYMPELEWKFGYPLVLGVMLCIGVGG